MVSSGLMVVLVSSQHLRQLRSKDRIIGIQKEVGIQRQLHTDHIGGGSEGKDARSDEEPNNRIRGSGAISRTAEISRLSAPRSMTSA